jgi:hypothetical protein
MSGSMRRPFVKSLVFAFVGFTALFTVEFLLEWDRLGRPGLADMSWVDSNNAKLVDILSPMARAYNNVLAMLLATIGLAIPLTANMHTPKLIDVFLRDKINRVVLSFMALGAGHVLFVDYIIGPKFAPIWAIRVAVFTAIVGWALLIPYFFYVVRFLDPSRVIDRLREDAQRIVDRLGVRQRDANAVQAEASARIDQIGTIVLKSLDRGDRGVAREGIWALKQLLDHHAEVKRSMPAAWFVVDRADFVGLSTEALEMLNEDRNWYEMKCLTQLLLAYQNALIKAPDAISSISDATRVIATRAAQRGDEPVLRLCIRFFNNYLREAIKRKDLHALYDVFYQYRGLARELADKRHAERLLEIGRHFVYYAEMARMHALHFAQQLAVFDLGYVVRRAYEAADPVAGDLLALTLALPHRHGDDVHAMAVKAKLMLGGFFVEHAHLQAADRVRANLSDVPAETVAAATADLLAAERCFFEITDHQVNLEYVPPERREPLERFAGSMAG